MGTSKTNGEARRKLRRRLEARGVHPDEIARQVENLAERQRNCGGPSRVANLTGHAHGENARRKRSLARRDGPACHWCGVALDPEIAGINVPSPPRATLDHVIPRSAGGSNSLENLVLSCEPCNQDRGGVHGPGGFVTAGTPSRPYRAGRSTSGSDRRVGS